MEGGQSASLVLVEAGCGWQWRLGGLAVEAGHRRGGRSAERNPSLSVSRRRVITPSQAVSITNKGDWRECGSGGGVW